MGLEKKKNVELKDHFLKQEKQDKMSVIIFFPSFPGFTIKRKKEVSGSSAH